MTKVIRPVTRAQIQKHISLARTPAEMRAQGYIEQTTVNGDVCWFLPRGA